MDKGTTPAGARLVATTDKKPTGKGWRRRAPLALFAFVCTGALVAALTGAGKPLPGGGFAAGGHWIYNSVLQEVFHVDGGTANVDAHAPIPGDPGSQVVQGDTSGYVVGDSRITQFGRSSLSVERTITPPADEVPLGIQAAGGPYLVYRNAGKIVRLGDQPVTVSAGGAVGDPVVTADGTLWLHRPGVGLICKLPKHAGRISSCPVAVPKDHDAALTMVGDRPKFVDLTARTVHAVDDSALGAGVPLGVPVPPAARPAANDVGGRVAILDPVGYQLILADPQNPAAKPVTVTLPPGEYGGPVSTGSAVALVDLKTNTLLTYGSDGKRKDAKPIPQQQSGPPRLSRGEDNRVYVENGTGTHVLVVGKEGKVQDTAVTGKPATTPGPEPSRTPDASPSPPAVPEPAPVPASAPGAPASVRASAGDGLVTVTWGAAADNRSPITAYQVSWRASTGATGSTTVSGRSRQVRIGGLTNGIQYVVTVRATNRKGTGPGVSAAPVTPVAATAPVPSPAPTAGCLRAVLVEHGQWETGYGIEYIVTNRCSTTVASWKLELDLPDGTTVKKSWNSTYTRNGQHYTFRNVDYSGDIQPGESEDMGINIDGFGRPSNCRINGSPC
ncbi:cellulose binding domain-containing protein [Allorhizocola rhizosphaerae]|uniref:cellulose binding domain-containing protein n=1 Tax=Allorhizocola rhizosphaerae TaxID=1872709 RepID=UPI000E3E9576|nr:cellulose binding domain-containing protein [Allorhizocola rhizosphaerae]